MKYSAPTVTTTSARKKDFLCLEDEKMGIDKILDDISDQISEKNEYLSEPVQKKSSSTGD